MMSLKKCYGVVGLTIVSALVIDGCKPRKPVSSAKGYGSGGGYSSMACPSGKIQNACVPKIADTREIYKGDTLVSWVDGEEVTDWKSEIQKRENCIHDYICDGDVRHAAAYGFNMKHVDSGTDQVQHPALAWNWFKDHPVGFGGVPYVLLKTILDLDPTDDTLSPGLQKIARIWHRQSVFEGESKPGDKWKTNFTIDHMGFGPNPEDYRDGVALPDEQRKYHLPSGLVYEGPATKDLPGATKLGSESLANLDNKLKMQSYIDLTKANLVKLKAEDWVAEKVLGIPKEKSYKEMMDKKLFQKTGGFDEVFFSCAGCHVGRVMVDGKMKFAPGLPNTEAEGQYYSKLLMMTTEALVDGFDSNQPTINRDAIKPKADLVIELLKAMVTKARDKPESLYGSTEDDIRRAKIQAIHIAENFTSVLGDVVAVGLKTHFIYITAAKQNGYKDSATSPDVLESRPGQMDAFGIAAGLVGIHSKRPDNTYIKFMAQQGMQDGRQQNPLFNGTLGDYLNPIIAVPTFSERLENPENLGSRIVQNMNQWLPHVPAAIDIRSLVYTKDNALANWEGNQDASARTLASGTSATGDPRKVNVRIHEPLNPFIDNLPPTPYPFGSVDLAKAKEGKKIFNDNCVSCHSPQNAHIYTIDELQGIDPNRSTITSAVSQIGLGSLVMEACVIYATQNLDKPGYNWCLPKTVPCKLEANSNSANPNWCKPQLPWAEQMDAYYKDVPGRVRDNKNGYKADVLHAIWGRAPYFHNGSVPTLGHVLCSKTRPKQFVRGNLFYDEVMVGFEWAEKPKERYSAYDVTHTVDFDTGKSGRHNTGHTFGDKLCPQGLDGLDPVANRKDIEKLISDSDAGKVIEFLKTL